MTGTKCSNKNWNKFVQRSIPWNRHKVRISLELLSVIEHMSSDTIATLVIPCPEPTSFISNS